MGLLHDPRLYILAQLARLSLTSTQVHMADFEENTLPSPGFKLLTSITLCVSIQT